VENIRAAIIGCGNLGRTHAKCLAEIDGIESVAYCDVVEAAAQGALDEFGGDYATCDVARVINDESVHAVYVATRHDSHADLCVAALEAGKHVFVEKPLAMSVEDCLRIGAAEAASGGKLMVGFKMRYYDMVLKARELMPRPDLVTMQIMDSPWAPDGWVNDPVAGGGNVLAQGCHATDLIRFLAGADPQTVYAVGGNVHQKTGVVDTVAAAIRFVGGSSGNWVEGDLSTPPLVSKFFAQMFCQGESITLSDRLTTLTHRAGGETTVFTGSETGFIEENVAFVRAIREDARPEIGVEDGLYATLTILQAIESLSSGQPEPVADLVEKGN
jgi:predicted dehydrogenase